MFTNLIASADREGFVDKTPRAIADEVGITEPQVRSALDALELPDPESRSQEKSGARIERIHDHRTWGWQIVNYTKYRTIRDHEERMVQNRLAQQRHRAKLLIDNGSNPMSAGVSRSQPSKPRSSHAEADAEAEGLRGNPKKGYLSGEAPDAAPLKGKQAKNAAIRRDALTVLEFLNTKALRAFQPVPANLRLIEARLREGTTVVQLRQVIVRKVRDWQNDPKMREYLRPATLFNATKCAQYIGELVEDFKDG